MLPSFFRPAARVVAGGVLAAVVLAAPASAHVTVNPSTATQGGYAKLTFRVPAEKPDATTTKVEVDFPTDHPFKSVNVQPHDGWTYDKETVTAADGTQAIGSITWTAAAGGGVKPGEFDEFNIQLGPLPSDATSLIFKALQTYSDGDVVRWIETTPAGGAEPEHPAPVLTLTPATTTTALGASTTSGAASKDDDSGDGWSFGATGVAIVALLVAIGALATRRKS